MEIVRIRIGEDEWEQCNYTKNLNEIREGLFINADIPLLMEFHFFIRPVTMNTFSRNGIHLPLIDMLSFDKNFRFVRKFSKIPNEKEIRMMFKEKYVLEIPERREGKFQKLSEIKKLAWKK